MEKAFIPAEQEKELSEFWEKNGYLTPQKGEPYTILMPPPNANASLHAGHGMYSVDDIVTRWKRLNGFASHWLPGMDHAGFETQYVYEKHLKKNGQSRLDFDRKTLYDDIFAFVKENSGHIYTQLRRLGFLADWDRSTFTLDDSVIDYVYETFSMMVKDGYVYRDTYIVNYCPHCGTSLADLETVYVTRIDPLYYIKYGPFIVATVRPETKFGDTALAVHPDDARYKEWIGKEVEIEGLLGKFKLKVIADDFVDPEFGTGVVKITPAHDPNDFEASKRHNLELKQVIDLTGRLTDIAGKYAGMNVNKAREAVVADLQEKGLMEKIDTEYEHSVTTCYKCGRDVEPMTFPNWFIKVAELKERVKKVVENDEVTFHPAKYKGQMLQWLDVMHDWPISRQIVWGIRIPVWYKIDENAENIYVWWLDGDKKLQKGTVGSFIKKGMKLSDIEAGLQRVMAQTGDSAPEHIISSEKPGSDYLPETDTFDTWFSSGQWPLVTVKDGEHFPTDFMGTASEILKFWISRMMMFSLYRKNEVPFKDVYLWSLVTDSKGIKMSKSKGNVVNPIELVDQCGADAFRASLMFGIAQGGRVPLGVEKVRAMRNYANKVWNIGRFIMMGKESVAEKGSQKSTVVDLDDIRKEFSAVHKKFVEDMNAFRFQRAFDDLYEFMWHRLADIYIEQLKDHIKFGNIEVLDTLEKMYSECLKLLHPFMPFVTEAVWKEFYGKETSILDERIITEFN